MYPVNKMEQIDFLQKIIDESRKIVFFGGAGVSTESGIPDFRSEDGLYRMKYKYSPEYMLSHSCFMDMPEEFFRFYREKILSCTVCQPNPAHKKLAEMEQKGKLLSVVTQNIDGLHQKAGSKRVWELHGTVYENFCERCSESFTADEVKSMSNVPRCKCGGIIKPKVVLYEEGLDYHTVASAVEDIQKADTLIIGGTSLVVYPAASFVDYFRGKYLVIINKGEPVIRKNADLYINDSIGKVFSAIEV